MPKRSALFNLYQERISRCKSSDELLKLSREITTKSFKGNEKLALTLACIFAAKWFDKHGRAPSGSALRPFCDRLADWLIGKWKGGDSDE